MSSGPKRLRFLTSKRARLRLRRVVDKMDQVVKPQFLTCMLRVLEELSVAGPTAESYRRQASAFITWCDHRNVALVEGEDTDRALCAYMTHPLLCLSDRMGW